MKRVLFMLVVVGVVAVAAAAGTGYWYISTPASDSPESVVVEIPKGSGMSTIARKLADAGVVNYAKAFQLYVRASGKEREVKAGEYRFARDLPPKRVLAALLRGQTVRYEFTIPEGLHIWQIAKVIDASKLAKSDELLLLMEDETFAQELGVPADRLEGYLFPDTYEFDKLAGARKILATMVKNWRSEFPPEYETRAAELNMSIHQVVTLASIIEKETGKASERPTISGVFHNRLKKKMRLETDPTVIYNVKDYQGNIRYRHLRDKKNPYNTYVIFGLPPGPIASPGAAAIKAALWPEEHGYLYFVSKNDGSHVFSETYKEHNRWVTKYQRRKRRKKKR